MTSILSAKPRASRRPTLLEMSLSSLMAKSKQRQGKKREPTCNVEFVWAPPSSLLVILHYLLKSNIQDFNTGWYTNQLSEPLRFLPSMLGGVSGKWEDQR